MEKIVEGVYVEEFSTGERTLHIHSQSFKLPAYVKTYSTNRGLRFAYQMNGKRYNVTTALSELYVEKYEEFIRKVERKEKLYSIEFKRKWVRKTKLNLPTWIGVTSKSNIKMYAMYDPILDQEIPIGHVDLCRREDLIFLHNKLMSKLNKYSLTSDDIF